MNKEAGTFVFTSGCVYYIFYSRGANMGFITKLKFSAIKKSIDKRKLAHAFDAAAAEHYVLAPDADSLTNNSYYFSAHGADGTSLFFRMGLRGGGAEVWFAYLDRDGNTFKNAVEYFPSADDSGVSCECAETAKVWRFNFSGSVYKSAPDTRGFVPQGEPVHAEFRGEFTAASDIFEFSRHMASEPVARALSAEKWNKKFKEAVRLNHQTHYEQYGHITGELKTDGFVRSVSAPAIRDHSYGRRDWGYMDRHIWLAGILEDGRLFNMNMVSYPALRGLQTGYVIDGKKVTCLNYATPLKAFLPEGNVPDEVRGEGVLMDGAPFSGVCRKDTEFDFPFAGGAYTICEGVGSFEINGVKGRGVLEFGFNGDPARWRTAE
jgi:hypothetical protein